MITMQVDDREFAALARLTKTELDTVTQDAYRYFRGITPIRSGNARRHTTQSGDSIIADYPYAERLNHGWSRQAPDGMVGPTIDHIEKKLIPAAIGRINRG